MDGKPANCRLRLSDWFNYEPIPINGFGISVECYSQEADCPTVLYVGENFGCINHTTRN